VREKFTDSPDGAGIRRESEFRARICAAPLSTNANAPLIIVDRDNALGSVGRERTRERVPAAVTVAEARAHAAALEKRETRR